MMSTNEICFRGVCRIFRNAVVQHIRLVLAAKYPNDWNERIAVPFKKEWNKIKEDAELLRKTGELDNKLTDDADLLSVNHFYNLFELYFDDIFPADESETDIVRKQKKQAILTDARNIKNLRDPALGHPGDADLSPTDAFLMLESARKILRWIDPDSQERLHELRDSVMAAVGSEMAEDRRLEGSLLPSRESVAPRFVGREAELGELSRWSRDLDSRFWLLAGDGGKGKTAIAYEFAVATRDNPPPELEIVIWLSAKARRFISGNSVDIENPDFWDLNSALDWVLRAYGAEDFEDKEISAKSQECLEYLDLLPALIVLDDVDSLEDQNVDAMTFFVHHTHRTKSKFLLTSRRTPFGMQPMATQVNGFDVGGEDGIKFIDSRIKLYRLDPKQFTTLIKRRILEVCDGSPLFVEDLMRLCIVGETPSAAINAWQESRGEAARRYALEREFEMLSESARKVLLACALFPGPVSLPEIEVAAEIRESDCHAAIQELQRLFLLPRPELVEDVPRFGLNANTRRLVIEVQGGSDLERRILGSIKVITGQTPATPAHRQNIGQYIRQAVSFVKLDRHSDAEATLEQALDRYPENADLHGNLGWVYKAWKPPRHADARNRFERAAQLKSSKEDMYRHWWEMEKNRLEWTSAASAAETGLANVELSHDLAYMAGLARSQLAKDLYQQTQYSRAEQEARKAERHLLTALRDPGDLEQGKYQSQSRIHRSLVINYEHLVRISRFQNNIGVEKHFLSRLRSSLSRWSNEHPNDPYVSSERQRLISWFPEINGQSEI